MPNDDLATRAEVMVARLSDAHQVYGSLKNREDAATLIADLLTERAADKERIGRLEGALRAILDLTCVGRPGSTGLGTKWCSYPSKLYHAARAALSTGDAA